MRHLTKRVLFQRKPLLVSGLVILVLSVANGILWFILPQFAEELTGSLILVGVLTALPALASIIADIPLGDFTERVGERLVMQAGFLCLMIFGLVLSTVDSAAELAVFLFLFGFALQMVYVPLGAHVMEISPGKRRSEYFGAYHSMYNLGFSAGPLLGGVLVGASVASGLLPASIAYTLLCVVALSLVHSFIRDLGGRERVLEGVKDVIGKDRLVAKSITDFKNLKGIGVSVLVLSFLFTFFDGMIWTLAPIYQSRLGFTPVLGGLLLTAFTIPLVLVEYPAGLLADKYGRRRVLATGLVLAGASAIAFSAASSPALVLSTAFLASTGLAFCWPAVEGMLLEASGGRDVPEVAGVWETSMDAGYVAGPVFGGAIAFHAGIPAAFAVAGVMLLASMVFARKMR